MKGRFRMYDAFDEKTPGSSEMGSVKQYEIELEYVGKRKRPSYLVTEYGFYPNPPIVINATSRKDALGHLDLPKSVRVKSMKSFKRN